MRNARISLDHDESGQNLHIRGRIREIFDDHSKDISNLKLKFFEESFRRQIKELIAEDQGINPSNFMNVEIFKLEIEKRIKEAGDDSANFVDRIKQEVESFVNEVIDSCFGKFEELASQIKLSARDELTLL